MNKLLKNEIGKKIKVSSIKKKITLAEATEKVGQLKKKLKRKDLEIITLKRKVDDNDNHRHAIIENLGNNHASMGITTKKTKGNNKNNNIRLGVNPVLDDKGEVSEEKKSYMRKRVTFANKNDYTDESFGVIVTDDLIEAKRRVKIAKSKTKKL